jgi:DNA phosphorothioation-associated putative methyltransferase
MSGLIFRNAIARHRTAMVRHTLSQPVSLLVRLGVVREGTRFFDYGCGQGDDLQALAAAGIEGMGWDPHFSPDTPRAPAAVVNLGFVINVIEDPAERREALVGAWKLTTGVLAVSAMVIGAAPTDGLEPFGDGFLTSRGTFQKYYQHSELRAFIVQHLGVDPVAVAPGIFFAFRDPADQEEFLLRRRTGRRASTSAYRSERARVRRHVGAELDQRIGGALDEIADVARTRGRMPHSDDLSHASLDELARERVSLARAIEHCGADILDENELTAAAAAMREDLLVHYALARLNRSTTAARPSAAMIRDIRSHFGSQAVVAEQAMEYLMGLADDRVVASAIEASIEKGTGVRDERSRLVVDASRTEELPGILRCYLGCATFLAGDPDETSLVRIDPPGKRVSFLPLDDRGALQPVSPHIIVVDLKRQSLLMRTSRRRLLRKSELFEEGLVDPDFEEKYRATLGMTMDTVFERVEG